MKNNDEALSIKKDIDLIIAEIDYLHATRLLKVRQMQDVCTHPGIHVMHIYLTCPFCGKVIKR